ncbi:MAG: hypothetical protein A2161_15840 [Candidatus Schekmanbacteria bacterium RBG_13_48_7]|uniref:Ig-like domain-containing protein n=1 Tax=Candidatus Schekmanbacteria bacterium RBG_13_48_7 TaxID=1817878 RepID=A0A1F7RPJ1_9BACT|nr:MAG: hypothetical protein A2161_15840 [Candidatus Schekmanbacteria bacterium RBG_13_48_7]
MRILNFMFLVISYWMMCTTGMAAEAPTPTPVIPPGYLNCTGAIYAHCGDIITGDTGGLENNAENYSCNALTENGPEQVFILNLTYQSRISCTILDGTFLNIYLLKACNENTCIIWNTDSFTSEVLEPALYYIVLDSWISESYQIQIECDYDEPQPTATPVKTPDIQGPMASACSMDNHENYIEEGRQSVGITAWIDDTLNGNSIIASAEYFIDVPGACGSGELLHAADGVFDSQSEWISGAINTSTWVPENSPYHIYIHGIDVNNSWGDFCAFDIEVKPSSTGIPLSVPVNNPVLKLFLIIIMTGFLIFQSFHIAQYNCKQSKIFKNFGILCFK